MILIAKYHTRIRSYPVRVAAEVGRTVPGESYEVEWFADPGPRAGWGKIKGEGEQYIQREANGIATFRESAR